jgi:hypothetical protein
MTRPIIVGAMPYQEEALFDFDTPILGVAAGKRSGKSRLIIAAKSIIYSSLHRGKPIVVASPTYGMTRRNLLPIYRELAEAWGLDIEGLNTKSPQELVINWGGVKSIIHLDVTIENYERMNGMSLAGLFVDEIDKARHEDALAFLEEAIFRCSNPAAGRTAQINIVGAPELNGPMAEFFVENASPDKKLYKWSMMWNYMLSDEYKSRILATIPANKRAGWVDGDFMYNSDGLVYECFDPKESHTDLTLNDRLPNENVLISFDLNLGGMSCVLFLQRGNVLFAVDEWMKLRDTKDILDRIKKQPWADFAVVTCDPACTQVFPYIHESRTKHKIMKAAPEISHRVTAVNLKFKNATGQRQLFVNTNKCRILTKCLMRQGYVNGEPDKKTPIAEAGTDISGPIDAFGYGVYLQFPYSPVGQPRITLRGL